MSNRLFPYCVYTIKHSDDLEQFRRTGGEGSFTEHRQWVTGAVLLEKAAREGADLPLVLAAAEVIDGLIYWAAITRLELGDRELGPNVTTVHFRSLKRIRPKQSLRMLRLRSSGQPLSENFIRPYAICHTPRFLRA